MSKATRTVPTFKEKQLIDFFCPLTKIYKTGRITQTHPRNNGQTTYSVSSLDGSSSRKSIPSTEIRESTYRYPCGNGPVDLAYLSQEYPDLAWSDAETLELNKGIPDGDFEVLPDPEFSPEYLAQLGMKKVLE